MKKTVFILSGSSGVGKDTLWSILVKRNSHIEKFVTCTTREMRKGETEGVEYYFISKEEFLKRIDEGKIIEYEYVHGENIYGSTYEELERVLSHDKIPFYIVEPKGMHKLKPTLEKRNYNVETIFILPPSIEVLEKRRGTRGTETQEELENRKKTTLQEMEYKDDYNHTVINDNLDTAVEEIETIIHKYAV